MYVQYNLPGVALPYECVVATAEKSTCVVGTCVLAAVTAAEWYIISLY